MKKLIAFLLIMNFTCSMAMGQRGRRSMTTNPNSGYANFNEVAAGYGLSGTTLPNSEYFYGATTTHGYQLNIYGLNINRSFFAGIGTGALFYEKVLYIPLSFNLRFIWNTGKVSPYITGDGGFLFNPDDLDRKTLTLINGGGGVQFKINKNFFVNLGTGLGVQMGLDGRRSFINAKLGLGFKAR